MNTTKQEKAPRGRFRLFAARGWIQALTALGTNAHLSGFVTGKLYSGPLKTACVPGLNCYSCPGAVGACPIGATQAILSGRKHNVAFYTLGILMLFGLLLGRVICGFLCPFGWLQELLNKLPPKKKPHVPLWLDRPLRWLKYLILAVFVIALPILLTNEFGLGAPYFCKLICPAGTLEGGIPMLAFNESLRSGVGGLFAWKFTLMLLTLAAAVLIYRPFCKYVCPLGAFYALFNRVSLARMELEREACVNCGKCERVCKMEVNVRKNINSMECIRCGACASACPTGAIRLKFGRPTLRESELPVRDTAK